MKYSLIILLLAVCVLFPILHGCGKGKQKENVSSIYNGDDDVNMPDDDAGGDDDGHWDDDADDDSGADDTETYDDDVLNFPDDPGETGPFSVGQQSMNFHDPGSQQDHNLLIVYPTADGGATIDGRQGACPIIIFGPGLSLTHNLYLSYGQHFASWGFVTVMRDNWSLAHSKLGMTTMGIIDWLQDQIASNAFFQDKIDLGHIGTTGHSLGGKISLLAAALDVRVSASADIDPVDSLGALPIPPEDYPSVTPELMPSIHRPTLFVGSELGGTCAPAEDNYQQYYQYANSPSIEIMMRGAGHMSFLDNPQCGAPCTACDPGTTDDARVRRLTKRYIVAFYNVNFLGKDEYEKWITGSGIASDVEAGYVTTTHK